MKSIRAIGLMSGSSLDGLDIAIVQFNFREAIEFTIEHFETIAFTSEWENALRGAALLSGKDLISLDTKFGKYVGEHVHKLLSDRNEENVDIVVSHGHTVFHNPEEGYSFQLGNGSWISEYTKTPVLCNLRSGDIAAGGQGAPIVPICDARLFSSYDILLNLGGIGNCTYLGNHSIVAFDLFPFNQVLNYYSNQLGMPYDDKGILSSKGIVSQECVRALHQIEYIVKAAPKSLDNSFSREIVIPVLDSFLKTAEDKLATYIRFCVQHFSNYIKQLDLSKGGILVSGGGAYHAYFIDCLQKETNIVITIPSKEIIEGKEALAMALIGALYLRGEVNIEYGVSGAVRGVLSGALYQGRIL